MDLTVEALKEAKFRGPVAFYDGRDGVARQDFECVEEPRFGYFWRRDNRQDRGRQAYMVDGQEVENLYEAVRLLGQPKPDTSPDALRRKEIDEFLFSPPLNYGSTHALSEGRCNASVGPFGMLRAWWNRAENAWHQGINRYSDIERTAGRDWPEWLYDVKSAAAEGHRAMYLFSADRKEDTDLVCAMNVRCRDCPILRNIETAMVESRDRRFPSAVEDVDIDAAKVWTCLGHMLRANTRPFDGAFFGTKHDRGE